MAYAKVNLKNEITGEMKVAPIGFSWTVLFFGPFPTLFRGDWKWFAIILISGTVTMGISSLVFMFIYNKLSLKDLLMKGYKATSFTDITEEALVAYSGMDISKFTLEEAST
ncbi:MAG: hypothetical protein JKY92_08565 [Magnetovibrio sp.]|nr:hypothetical protein [Magnetovibrio sp.]